MEQSDGNDDGGYNEMERLLLLAFLFSRSIIPTPANGAGEKGHHRMRV